MKNFLLDKDSHYILKMINLLNAAPNHELTLSELETELGLAKQTVKSYFDKLLDYCHAILFINSIMSYFPQPNQNSRF